MRTLTLKQRLLPSFLDVRSSLLLEELTMQQSEPSSSPPTAFVARRAPTPPPRGPVDNTMPPRCPDICRTSNALEIADSALGVVFSTLQPPNNEAASPPALKSKAHMLPGHPCRILGQGQFRCGLVRNHAHHSLAHLRCMPCCRPRRRGHMALSRLCPSHRGPLRLL
jgi:hypothetical protein